MSPPSLVPQSVPASAIKPHAVSPCTETYMTTTPPPSSSTMLSQPKAQIMTLLQFKQFSTPTVAPTVIPLANIKPITTEATTTTETTTTTTTISSSSQSILQTEAVPPQTNQKQNAQNQQSQNLNVQNIHNDIKTTTTNTNNNNSTISTINSPYTTMSKCDQSSEDCCNDLVTKNDMLCIDTTDASPTPTPIPHASTVSVSVATTLNTSQTTFSMVAKPHLTSITGRTKQNVHKVC